MMTLFAASANLLSITTTITARLTAETRTKRFAVGLEELAGSWLRASGLFGIFLGLMILALGPILDRFFLVEGQAVVISLALLVALQVVLLSMRGVLQGVEAFGVLAVSLASEAAFRTGFAIVSVKLGFGVGGALYAYVLGAAISLGYTLVILQKRGGFKFGGAQLRFQKVFKLTWGVAGATISLAALSSVDVLLVKHYFVGAEPGLYGIVAASGRILLLAASFVPVIVLPKAAAGAASGRSARDLLLPAGLAVIGISIVGLLAFGMFPEFVVRLMGGSGYLAASRFILGYGSAMSVLGLSAVVVAYRIGLNDFRFVPATLSVVVLEVVGIVFFHGSITQIIWIVVGANLLALCAILCGVASASKRAKEAISKADHMLRLEEVIETM